MASFITHMTTKKTYFYTFYPVKSEEALAGPNGLIRYPRRMLVEIRDVRPAPVQDPRQPWQIRKSLNQYEVSAGKIVIPFHETFEYILRYWNMCMTNHVAVLGHRVSVIVWDVTNERQMRKYDGSDVYLQCSPSENYVLSCTAFIRDRSLKVDDCVALFWDPSQTCFRVKVFYSYSNIV